MFFDFRKFEYVTYFDFHSARSPRNCRDRNQDLSEKEWTIQRNLQQ